MRVTFDFSANTFRMQASGIHGIDGNTLIGATVDSVIPVMKTAQVERPWSSVRMNFFGPDGETVENFAFLCSDGYMYIKDGSGIVPVVAASQDDPTDHLPGDSHES